MKMDARCRRLAKQWQQHLESTVEKSKNTFCTHDCQTPNNLQEYMLLVCDKQYLRVPWLDDYLSGVKNIRDLKDSNTAADLRKRGNELYQRKQLGAALESYTKSLILASEMDGHNHGLSFAYANRSAVFFHMKKYKECLTEIERALSSGYPEGSTYKLLQRKAQCCVHLQQNRLATAAFKEARTAVENLPDISPTDRENTLSEIDDWMKKLDENQVKCTGSMASDTDMAGDSEAGIPELTPSSNPIYQNASSLLTVRYSQDKGRHFVAAGDISPGDTLIVEQPYAAVLLPDNYKSHCFHCFVKLPLNPVVCRRCTQALYCCTECKQESWETYHQWDCPYLDLMHIIGVAHLSLRIVLKTGIRKLKAFRDRQHVQGDHQIGELAGLSPSGKYENNYMAVHGLIHHIDKFDTDDMIQYVMTAALLLEVMKSSGFFHQCRSSPAPHNTDAGACRETEDELLDKSLPLYVAGLLLQHVLQIVVNAHAITELQPVPAFTIKQVTRVDEVRIATAVYPTVSLINHSCEPSVIASFYKDTMVLRATKPIKKGCEVLHSYGPLSSRMTKLERREALLSQYKFMCQCSACVTQDCQEDESQYFQAFRCQNCEAPLVETAEAFHCQKCTQSFKTQEIREKAKKAERIFVNGIMMLEEENLEEALKMLKDALQVRRAILYRNNQQLGHSYDSIARCLAAMGDYKQSATYLASSISITEAIYGSKSVEVANELQKLTDIQINARLFSDTRASSLKAIDIFKVVYGEKHSTVVEMKDVVAKLDELAL